MTTLQNIELAKRLEFDREHYQEEPAPMPHEGYEGGRYRCGVCQLKGSKDWLDYHKHEPKGA